MRGRDRGRAIDPRRSRVLDAGPVRRLARRPRSAGRRPRHDRHRRRLGRPVRPARARPGALARSRGVDPRSPRPRPTRAAVVEGMGRDRAFPGAVRPDAGRDAHRDRRQRS